MLCGAEQVVYGGFLKLYPLEKTKSLLWLKTAL